MDPYIIILFIIGLFFGSFYDCLANRLPKGERLNIPGSHCENCDKLLSWYELIPVFSYLFLRGKCIKCKHKLSLEYPIVELITGLLFSVSYLFFGLSIDTLISICLVSVVIIIFISDFKYMVILDEVLIVGVIIIGICFFIKEGFIFLLFQLYRGLIVFMIMLIIKLLGDKIFKQESLGWGDIKLSFLAGFILGIKLGILHIFLGSVLALPYALYVTIRKKDKILPFGPFLSAAILIIFWTSPMLRDIINILLGGKV